MTRPAGLFADPSNTGLVERLLPGGGGCCIGRRSQLLVGEGERPEALALLLEGRCSFRQVKWYARYVSRGKTIDFKSKLVK